MLYGTYLDKKCYFTIRQKKCHRGRTVSPNEIRILRTKLPMNKSM